MMLNIHARLYNLAAWGFMQTVGDDTVKISLPGIVVEVYVSGERFISQEIVADVIREKAGLILNQPEFDEAYREAGRRAANRAKVTDRLRGGGV